MGPTKLKPDPPLAAPSKTQMYYGPVEFMEGHRPGKSPQGDPFGATHTPCLLHAGLHRLPHTTPLLCDTRSAGRGEEGTCHTGGRVMGWWRTAWNSFQGSKELSGAFQLKPIHSKTFKDPPFPTQPIL